MAQNVVRILLTAKDEVSSTIDKIRDKAELLGKTEIGKGILQGVGQKAATVGLNMVQNAVGGVADAMGTLVKAGMDEEESISRLGASLKANVPAWDGNTAAIEGVLKARLALGFSDEEQRTSLASLVAATHDTTKALEIERTAMDLARFKGISLAEASDALVKVEAGQYRMLKSLGIVLKDGATQQDALNAVQKVATGQAEDYANTVAGKAVVAQTKFNEKLDEIGSRLLPMVSGALTLVAAGLEGMDAATGSAILSQAGLEGNMRYSMHSAKVVAQSVRDAGTATRDYGYEVDNATGANKTFTSGTGTLTGSFADIDRAIETSRSAWKNLTSDVNTAFDALMGKTFDPEQLKLKLKLAQGDIASNQEALDILLGKKGKTKADYRQIDELKLRISESKEEALKLAWGIATVNGTDLSGARAWLTKYGDKLGDVAALWRDVIFYETLAGKRVSTITNAGGGGTALVPRAAGGPIAPYGTSLVGENGPELIRLGSSGGMVSPSVSGAGGAAAPVTVVMQSLFPASPGQAAAAAQALAPALAVEFRRRGLLPA